MRGYPAARVRPPDTDDARLLNVNVSVSPKSEKDEVTSGSPPNPLRPPRQIRIRAPTPSFAIRPFGSSESRVEEADSVERLRGSAI